VGGAGAADASSFELMSQSWPVHLCLSSHPGMMSFPAGDERVGGLPGERDSTPFRTIVSIRIAGVTIMGT